MKKELVKEPTTLLIACGALANEASYILSQPGLDHIKLTCLPAKLHNTPQKIPDLLRQAIRENKFSFEKILVLYGDCGTAGGIDEVLACEGATRIGGAHCYEFYAGSQMFQAMAEEEPASFYLTDFLVTHFERLVWQGLKLDKHPELLTAYFGNYKKLVYLAQLGDGSRIEDAKAAAEKLGLEFEYVFTGLETVRNFLTQEKTA
ncbi:DUF1638 domain-containing protein [Sneathiella glossodoripedis]|uniref:DUF1638 domain-containing protein n=1 Tax=Sneathiella glossodoripedis TaxID=418853 RepID=UPI000569630E|nr:DUF1638 domain-containing protein [Sneathiella glossodoripedis]